jgi:PAS domain S-box-containing protein
MQLLEQISDVVVALDNHWRYTYFNSKAEEVLGKKASEVIGRTLWQAFPEQLPSGQVHPKLLEARDTRTSQVFEYYLTSQDQWHETRVYPGENGLVLVTIDITDRKRADQAHRKHDEEVEAAKREMEAAARSKDKFIAQVSHELRTPLTPVMINLALLEELFEDNLDAITIISIIRRNLQHEIRLIDDLLDVTRISNGKLVLKHDTVGLHEVIANVASLTRHVIDEKQIKLNLTLLASDDKLWADETRIQQVLWNLLHNAVKFAPQNSTIKVRTVTRNGYVIITVQDEGIGIEPENLPHIFEPFEQTDKTVTHNFGGLGLGLTITRSLVHLHGGYITAHSEGRGLGATFRVQLPLKSSIQDLTQSHTLTYRDIIGYSSEPRRMPTIESNVKQL